MRSWAALALVFCHLKGFDAGAWETVRYRMRSYVTAEEVAKNYRFAPPTFRDGALQFDSDRLVMRWRPGSRIISCNGVLYESSLPVVQHQGKVLLSLVDLVSLIDAMHSPPDDSWQGGSGRIRFRIEGEPEGDGGLHWLAGEVAERLRALIGVPVSAHRGGGDADLLQDGDAEGVSSEEESGERGVVVKEEGDEVIIWLVPGGIDSELRSEILAPPSTVQTGKDVWDLDKTLYRGNLYDAANLALASMVHGWMVRVPGVSDGAVRRKVSKELRASGHPTLRLVFGRSLIDDLRREAAKAEQMAEALARGLAGFEQVLTRPRRPAVAVGGGQVRILEHRAFAVNELPGESLPEAEEGEESLEEGGEAAGEIQSKEDETAGGQEDLAKGSERGVVVRFGLGWEGDKEIQLEHLQLQVYAFDLLDGERVELIASEAPLVLWESDEPDWEGEERVDFVYRRPSAREGRPEFLGYVIRVIYQGQLQDGVAVPSGLRHWLSYFGAVFP
jgi:hypothetical protein